MNDREKFIHFVGQTSPNPLCIEPVKAEGIYIIDVHGKRYIDLIAGISVSNVGHGHPMVISAIEKQAQAYLHSMVYGEHAQSPQISFAQALVDNLPENLQQVYFVNSGSEAVEGAIKLAKRVTGRHKVVAVRGGYHGNTQAAMGLMDNVYYNEAFRPLMPGIGFIDVDDISGLQNVGEDISCVIMETIQGAVGYRTPEAAFMKALRIRCNEVGALLVLDEIQAGLGRSGKLWGFEHIGITPDILCLAKALGGGMPLGAFIASRDHMTLLTHDPVLGHITTFGGHPVSCAAGKAAFDILTTQKLWKHAQAKGKQFIDLLGHGAIEKITGVGLMLAVHLKNEEWVRPILEDCLDKGLITDGFLHNAHAIRIAPPLTISEAEISESCDILLQAIEEVAI